MQRFKLLIMILGFMLLVIGALSLNPILIILGIAMAWFLGLVTKADNIEKQTHNKEK